MIIGGNRLGYSVRNTVCAAYSTDNFSYDDDNVEYWTTVRQPDVILTYADVEKNSIVGEYIIDKYETRDGFVLGENK